MSLYLLCVDMVDCDGKQHESIFTLGVFLYTHYTVDMHT